MGLLELTQPTDIITAVNTPGARMKMSKENYDQGLSARSSSFQFTFSRYRAPRSQVRISFSFRLRFEIVNATTLPLGRSIQTSDRQKSYFTLNDRTIVDAESYHRDIFEKYDIYMFLM